MRELILYVLVLTLLLPGVVSAREYTVTPRVIEHDLTPRESLEEGIKVSNTGSVPVRIFPTVNAIELGPDGEIVTFNDPNPQNRDQTTDVASWLAISRARLELQPGETKRVPLTITVGPNAAPGEYYAFVGFPVGANRDEAEAQVRAGNAPGVTVRISIKDTSSEYLRLEQFTVDRFVLNPDDSQVTYRLANAGDTPVTPKGEIILYDVRGREVGSLPINVEGATIGAGEEKEFTSTVPDTEAYGRHKAFLNLEYGSKQRANLYDTTFYTVIPLPLILGTFAFLMVSSMLLTWLYYRRTSRRQTIDDEAVPLYVRTDVSTVHQDHDINLKSN